MVNNIYSFGITGIDAFKVDVETDVSRGLPAFEIVGMPDTAVKESKERVRSAYKNSGYIFPAKRITVNLAPASVKKIGSVYDLPIIVGLLKSTGELKCGTDKSAFIGELSLKGDVRPVNGTLPMVLKAKEMGLEFYFGSDAHNPEEVGTKIDYVRNHPLYSGVQIHEQSGGPVLQSNYITHR